MEDNSLRYLDHCKDACGKCDKEADYLHIVVPEIEEIMEAVGGNCGLVCFHTWILCKHCESLSIRKSLCARYGSSNEDNAAELFLEVSYLCTLKKGEGIVGKAATSFHNLVYCEDVSKFNIAEYLLTHFARHFKLTASFAICLRSNITRSQIYVLEFFLNLSEFNERGVKAMFFPIREKMRQNFRTFKLASGEEIGDNLSVQAIDARFPHKFRTVKIGGLNLVDNHNYAQISNNERVNFVNTSQQPLVQVNVVQTDDALRMDNLATDNGENMANNTDEGNVIAPLQRGGELMGVSGLKHKEAATKLNKTAV